MDTGRTSSSPRLGRQDCLLPLKLPIPARVPLLYVILGVLLAISVLPMYFYSAQIETMNRERLKTNEMLLQNTVTRSLANDIAYATLLNADAKGVSAGRIEPDAFLQRELERAFQAAREGRIYSGQPL